MEQSYHSQPPFYPTTSTDHVAVAQPDISANGSPIAVTLALQHQPERRKVRPKHTFPGPATTLTAVPQRHLFWLNAENTLMTASPWLPETSYSPPHSIPGSDKAVPGSKALAACSSIQNDTNGNTTDVRVYYGSPPPPSINSDPS